MRHYLVFGSKVGYALSRGIQHAMRKWSHEKEQCMKTFAFERWCDRLQLATATCDVLAQIRSSPPARRVAGRLLNVCGTYASRKMGVSIQFESRTVELWAIYTMEHNRDVLEFFDQPTQLELTYPGPSGRATRALHTPDFLVLREDGAAFEEWKPESRLRELMATHPGRYGRDESGKSRCPPQCLPRYGYRQKGKKIMSGDPFLEGVEARLSAVSGVRWEVIELDRGQLEVEVIFADGHRTVMQVTHERTPANNVDVLFIGRASPLLRLHE